MRFWDSSAIIPLCLKEPASEAVKNLAKADENIVVWWTTRVECISALARRYREGFLPINAEQKARALLTALAGSGQRFSHRNSCGNGRRGFLWSIL